MFVIGITGSLATGKSTASRMLAECGAVVFNADKIARRQLYRNGKCFAEVVRVFGAGILKNGRIQRKALAAIVFTDNKALKRLERIIHPVVEQYVLQQLQKRKNSKQVLVLDVPLLFEAKLDRLCDLVVVVTARAELQIQRATKKLGITVLEAKRRMKSQMAISQKCRRADVKIDNNQGLKQLRMQIEKIWKQVQNQI